MTDLVVDASVVLKWFRAEGETHLDAARSVRAAFAAGLLIVHAPHLVKLEIVNITGHRWGWDGPRLAALVESLEELGVTYADPDLDRVARWTTAGLTAYDAAYVALAEQIDSRLVTDDARILEAAPAIALAPSEVAAHVRPGADVVQGSEQV